MSFTNINTDLFYAINKIHQPLLDQFMLLGSRLGAFDNLFWLLLAGLLLLLIPKEQRKHLPWLPQRDSLIRFLATLLIACCMTAAVVMALKEGLRIPRPFVALPEGTVHLLTQPRSLYSFPSGHSAFAMLLAVVLWPCCQHPFCRGLLLFFALWVGLSRIILGLHFPADVLMGYVCGGGSAWLAGKIPSAVFDWFNIPLRKKNKHA